MVHWFDWQHVLCPKSPYGIEILILYKGSERPWCQGLEFGGYPRSHRWWSQKVANDQPGGSFSMEGFDLSARFLAHSSLFENPTSVQQNIPSQEYREFGLNNPGSAAPLPHPSLLTSSVLPVPWPRRVGFLPVSSPTALHPQISASALSLQ